VKASVIVEVHVQDDISVRVPKTHGRVTYEFNMQNLAAPTDGSAGCVSRIQLQ